VDRRPDLIGMLILATVTAVGGGVLRDLLLRRDPVFLRDGAYALAIVLPAVAVFFFPRALLRRETAFKYFDAVGLGVFSAITAAVTYHAGVNPLAVLLVATVVGCAGGIVRDVIIGRASLVLSNELYVTPVLLGAGVLMVAERLGAPSGTAFYAAMAFTTGMRVAAIVWDWRLPRVLVAPGAEPPRWAE
jgi:uncharacterized membrane protein YeiH